MNSLLTFPLLDSIIQNYIKVPAERGEVRACVSQGPFKQTEGFFTLYRGGGQKMPQKYQNCSQLSTAHFSGVLKAF